MVKIAVDLHEGCTVAAWQEAEIALLPGMAVLAQPDQLLMLALQKWNQPLQTGAAVEAQPGRGALICLVGTAQEQGEMMRPVSEMIEEGMRHADRFG